MTTTSMNPFDLTLSRAYSNPDEFCPRPECAQLLTRAAAGRLWTLIDGERRLGKSSTVIVSCVQAGRPILHVDLMGVGGEDDVDERFRWAWKFFCQQDTLRFFGGAKAEVSAGIPYTPVGVKLGTRQEEEPDNMGTVIAAFDRRSAKRGPVLFVDELQDLLQLPRKGPALARSLRATLQMARHLTPVFAGSSQHLLAPLFDTSASPFFKAIRLTHHLGPLDRATFMAWAAAIFAHQERKLEGLAVDRLFEMTFGVTEDIVAACAEIWVQGIKGRPVAPADVEIAWRCVVGNAAPLFLPRISGLGTLQSRLLRFIARNPDAQPFAEGTLRELGENSGLVHKALKRLLELDLIRERTLDRGRRVWVHDPRLAFYLRA
jgi:hypothetical protein